MCTSSGKEMQHVFVRVCTSARVCTRLYECMSLYECTCVYECRKGNATTADPEVVIDSIKGNYSHFHTVGQYLFRHVHVSMHGPNSTHTAVAVAGKEAV